jgi:hypothetical protein
MPDGDAGHLLIQRDWEAFAQEKDEAWLECRRRYGPAWGLRVGDALRQEAKRLRPGWPMARDRRADLMMHLRLIDALQRTPRPDR